MRLRLIDELISSWWVVAFILFAALAFKPVFSHLDAQQAELIGLLNSLNDQKTEIIAHKEQLRSEIQSLSDPQWVEMILKRELGLVAEGQKKVTFHSPY